MTNRGLMGRIALALLMVGLILAVADLLIVTLSVCLIAFAGILFGIFLNGLSRGIRHFLPVPNFWTSLAVLALLLALVTAGMWYLGDQLANQATDLVAELRAAVGQVADQLRATEWGRQLLDSASQQSADVSGLPQLMPHVWSGLQAAGWAATVLLVVFFVGAYVAFDPHLYTSGLIRLVAPQKRARAEEVLEILRAALVRWIMGRLISMAIVGVLTAIGLWWLEVPLPIALGVVAALLTFVPNIGPVLAAVPQVLLALQVGPDTALYVIAFNVALQGFESYLITPIVQRVEVALPPALVITVQLLMGVLLGVTGLMVAAPMTVVAMVLVQSLYIEDQLEDSAPKTMMES